MLQAAHERPEPGIQDMLEDAYDKEVYVEEIFAALAAVDFQYVGGGCGMKDLAYFVGSCFREEEAEIREDEVLSFYFKELHGFLDSIGSDVCPDELEADWRPLYHVAWADFHRFMKGWSPGHWKLSDYSERITREIIDSLQEARV